MSSVESTICKKSQSSVIHSSTAVVNGKQNEATVWPSSEDDDDVVSMVDRAQEIEDALNETSKAKNLDPKSRTSPILVKRKPSTAIADHTQPPHCSSTHTTVESKEKRHRSLLDCLDQNYFSESPNKIKRETIRCEIGSTSTANSSRTSDENAKKPNVDCCIDINDVSTSESTNALDHIHKLNTDEETNETIQNQTDKLETLHVVSDPGSDTPPHTDSSSPDIIPGTPPSCVPYIGTSTHQRTLTDYFKTKWMLTFLRIAIIQM